MLFLCMPLLYIISALLSRDLELFLGNKPIYFCPSNHASPANWIDVSRANCAVVDVVDESCKCHCVIPFSFPHYIYYRHFCQPQSSILFKIIKVFSDRRKPFGSKDLRRIRPPLTTILSTPNRAGRQGTLSNRALSLDGCFTYSSYVKDLSEPLKVCRLF